MQTFLILLLIIDIIMIGVFVFFYIRFKKVFELPWEDIKESIEKAQELVEELKKLRALPDKGSEKDLKREIHLLVQQGYSFKEIAKKLGVSEAEVELVLSSKKNTKK
uniref:RNA polymerase sigma-70 ECF-like HTH domain-containing protein n=1 Tax=Thermodesulfobacterium geofontis TaxID=1295609 RepID=A0A7V6CEM6_9BACT